MRCRDRGEGAECSTVWHGTLMDIRIDIPTQLFRLWCSPAMSRVRLYLKY